MHLPAPRVRDFNLSPLLVFFETTQACDLACRHCRASAQPYRDPRELDTLQSKRLIDEIKSFPSPPLLVLTGGDPFKRQDIFDLVSYATEQGLRVALTPSSTPLVDRRSLEKLAELGVSRLALSLDGENAESHDAFRQVDGSFERTLDILQTARACGLSIQINTTITRRNISQVDAMAELARELEVAMWSVFLLVPIGRGRLEERISPDEYEWLFQRLWRHAQEQPYIVKTTEAHHYRRYVHQLTGGQHRDSISSSLPTHGINDGRGIMFVSHKGDIYPSGFLPLSCGRFPRDSIVEVYQHAELFRKLRTPGALKGKCGACEYKSLCGGSRARAFAVHGDPLAEEPDCTYVPGAYREARDLLVPFMRS